MLYLLFHIKWELCLPRVPVQLITYTCPKIIQARDTRWEILKKEKRKKKSPLEASNWSDKVFYHIIDTWYMSLLGVAGGFIEQNPSGEGYVGFLWGDNSVFILSSLLWSFISFFYLLGKFLQKQWSDVNNILKYSAYNFPRLFQPDNL